MQHVDVMPKRQVTPSVARRLLRHELACVLSDAGVSHRQMAARLRVSRPAFSQMMAGKNLITAAALEVVLADIGASERFPCLVELLSCARSAPSREMPGDHELIEGLEAFAQRIEVYDSAVISPLLIDARRGNVLSEPDPPILDWIAEEHVLRRYRAVVPGLLELIELPHVTVQIVPTVYEPHPGLLGGFEIVYRMGRRTVVCEPTRRVTNYYQDHETVDDYRGLLGRVQELALSPEQSEELLISLSSSTKH